MHKCFPMYVCTLCVCLVPKKVRGKQHMPWEWSYRKLEDITWVLGLIPDILQEQKVLVTTEQLSSLFFAPI